ncbi:MAG: hypothetical protein RSB67_02340 [Clostridia bacterium]
MRDIYNEVVIGNNEEPIGIFCINTGIENIDNKNLEAAKKLSNKSGYELKIIDKSMYRQKEGLNPLSVRDQKRKNFEIPLSKSRKKEEDIIKEDTKIKYLKKDNLLNNKDEEKYL